MKRLVSTLLLIFIQFSMHNSTSALSLFPIFIIWMLVKDIEF